VTILLGNGSGSFTSSELGIYESSVAIADFNGDGIPDIAYAGTYGSGGFLLGTETALSAITRLRAAL